MPGARAPGSPPRMGRMAICLAMRWTRRAIHAWSQSARLTASDGQNGDLFGYALDKEGDTVAVGAYGRERDRGALYLFHKPATGWADATEDGRLDASNGESGDRFGVAVALAGDWVAVGADLEQSNGKGAGAVYLYSGPDWSPETP